MRGLWQDHFGNHQVVLSGPGSMRAEDHAMFSVVCVGGTVDDEGVRSADISTTDKELTSPCPATTDM